MGEHAQHTPGPWYQQGRAVYACHEGGITRMHISVESAFRAGFDDEETQLANARLIAASPDLLDALDACNDAFCFWQIGVVPKRPEDILALIGKVRSAIAKARGEA
jgi:hypothetical protein